MDRVDSAAIGLTFLGSAGLTGTVFRVGGRKAVKELIGIRAGT